MRDRNRRTNRMVDPYFQRGLVYRVGGMTLFYFLFCILVSIALPMAMSIVSSNRDAALAQVAFRLEVLFKVMLAPLLVTFAALWVHGLQETFRIAGPNYRFKKVFGQLRTLCVPRGVRIRDDDHLQDTASVLDEALVALHDEISMLKTRAAHAVEVVHNASAQASRETHQLAIDAVEEVSTALERFQLVGCAPACEPTVAEPIGEHADEEVPEELAV